MKIPYADEKSTTSPVQMVAPHSDTTVGLTNGITNGKVNGLTNGGGRINGTGIFIKGGRGIINGNGLINGNGMTNGSRERSYALMGTINTKPDSPKRKLATMIMIIILCTPFLILRLPVSVDVYMPKIQIDGKFDDWNDAETFTDQVSDVDEPTIDIIEYKLEADRNKIYIYLRTQDNTWLDTNELSVIRVFFESNDNGGYDIFGKKFERMIEVVGKAGHIIKADGFFYRGNGNDWLWSKEYIVNAQTVHNKTELAVSRIEIGAYGKIPRIFIAVQSYNREKDYSDALASFNGDFEYLGQSESPSVYLPTNTTTNMGHISIDGYFLDWTKDYEYEPEPQPKTRAHSFTDYETVQTQLIDNVGDTIDPNLDIENVKYIESPEGSAALINVVGLILQGDAFPYESYIFIDGNQTHPNDGVDKDTYEENLNVYLPVVDEERIVTRDTPDGRDLIIITDNNHKILIYGKYGEILSAKEYYINATNHTWEYLNEVAVGVWADQLEFVTATQFDFSSLHIEIINWKFDADIVEGGNYQLPDYVPSSFEPNTTYGDNSKTTEVSPGVFVMTIPWDTWYNGTTWVPVNTTLVESYGAFDWEAASFPIANGFSSDLSSIGPIRLGNSSMKPLIFQARNIANETEVLAEIDSFNIGIKNGNGVTYPYPGRFYLSYYLLSSKQLKEEIIIQDLADIQTSLAGNVTYEFSTLVRFENLTINGTNWDRNTTVIDGNIALNSGNLVLNRPFVNDSVGAILNLNMRIDPHFDDGAIITTLVPGYWLNNVSRVYPVIIDPTITYNETETYMNDSFIWDATPTVNYGNEVYLANGNVSGLTETYVRWNNITSDIDSQAKIINATIELHAYTNSGTGTYDFHIHNITSDWTELSITSLNEPTNNPIEAYRITEDIAGLTATPRWFAWNITHTTQAWVNGSMPNYGVKIQAESMQDGNYVLYHSSNNADGRQYDPRITITYSMPQVRIFRMNSINDSGSVEGYQNYDWVDLYNDGPISTNLTGWNLTDNDGNVITLDETLGPGENTTVWIYSNWLDDTVDDIQLNSSSGNIIDYVAWGADVGSDDDNAVAAGIWTDGTFISPFIAYTQGFIMSRLNTSDSDSPDDFRICYDHVVINEIMLDPIGDNENGQWMEIYNGGRNRLENWTIRTTIILDNDGHITYMLNNIGSFNPGTYKVVNFNDTEGAVDTSTEIWSEPEDFYLQLFDHLEGWQQPNGTWTILGGFVYSTNSLFFTSNTYSPYGNYTNISIEGNVSFIGEGAAAGYSFRIDDTTGEHYSVNVKENNNGTEPGGGDNVWISKHTAWHEEEILASGNFPLGIGPLFELRMEMMNDTINFWINDTFVISTTDGSYEYGKIGLRANRTGGASFSIFYEILFSINDSQISPMFDPDIDDAYILSYYGHLIDYIAWGGVDDDDQTLAVALQEWVQDDYIDLTGHIEGYSIGRDANSNDTDSSSDWAVGGGIDVGFAFNHTKGAQNIPDLPYMIAPIMIIAISFFSRRKRKNYFIQKEDDSNE